MASIAVSECAMAPSDYGTDRPERLHALDAVRGFALLLGIVQHAALSFIPPAINSWLLQDDQTSEFLSILYFASHSFRMTTFFLIAGFFAHMSYHRLGAAAFIKDRLKRIGLPLLVGWPIVFGAVVAVMVWAASAANGGRLTAPRAPAWSSDYSFAHLWFLYVLLELYAVTLLLRAGVVLIDRSGWIRAGIDRVVTMVVLSPVAPVMLAVPVAIVFLADPKWAIAVGIRTPDHLVTNLPAWIGYGAAFGFGWLLHRQLDLLRILERRWLINSVLAIALITAGLFFAGAASLGIKTTTTMIAGPICYALAGWTATFAVIGLALRFLSGFSAARRYIADASYWIYIVHLPIVMALQVAVSRLDWPWPVKFAAILAITFALTFASYQLLVRYSFIGVVLNGRRATRAQKLSTAAKVTVSPDRMTAA
jgi:hypothetical protein